MTFSDWYVARCVSSSLARSKLLRHSTSSDPAMGRMVRLPSSSLLSFTFAILVKVNTALDLFMFLSSFLFRALCLLRTVSRTGP